MVTRLALRLLGALLLTAGTASAQTAAQVNGPPQNGGSIVPQSCDKGLYAFQVDTPGSPFSFGGSIQINPLPSTPFVGTPPEFNPGGSVDVDLKVCDGVVRRGDFVGTGSVTVPTLNGVTQPALATIEVAGVEFSIRSVNPVTENPMAFQVAPDGTFDTSVIGTITAGQVEVTIIGSVAISLIGSTTDPTSISGTILPTVDGFQLNVPIDLDFAINDPVFGSGTFNVAGQFVADWSSLSADATSVSISSGGIQSLTLSTGGEWAGHRYLVVGSRSGAAPRPLASMALPFEADAFTALAIRSANSMLFRNTLGVLDANGMADAAIALPAEFMDPSFAGTTVDLAYVVLDDRGKVVFTSNSVPLSLTH